MPHYTPLITTIVAAFTLAWLLAAIAGGFEGGQAVQQARAINPKLNIVARAHSEEEFLHLMKHGASHVLMAEREIAMAMADRVR